MKHIIFIFAILILFSLKAFAQFSIGHASFSFTDPARANRTVYGEVYYPATVAGDDKPVANGQHPVIVFGHGFATVYSEYSNWWTTLVPEGYIMVLPRTEGGILPPSHENFAKDLSFLITKYLAEGSNSSSIFNGHIKPKTAVMGHSMGGGCSVYSAANNPAVTTMCVMAPIETNAPVSAITIAPNVTKPALIISGSADCVATSSQSAGGPIQIYTPMAASPYKAFVSITGGSHCNFGINSFGSNCSQGENGLLNSNCSGVTYIAQSAQHTQAFLAAKPWLKYWLLDDCGSWTTFHNNLTTNSAITYQESGTQPSLPVAQISGNSTICNNANTTLFASGGTSYLWSNNSTLSSISVNQAGTYTVSVTSGVCTVTATKTITNSVFSASISASSSTICQGSIATLTANSGTAYLWSTGQTASSINVTNPGTYTVTVTSTQGCTAVAGLNLQVTASPTVTINGPNTVCGNTPTTLTANGANTYSWSNGSNGANISVTQSGNYAVTATNGLGCTAVSQKTIVFNPNPTPNITQNPSAACVGSPIILTTGSNYSNYQWSNATSTSNILTVTQSGTYVVTVTDTNGCTGSAFQIVGFNPLPVTSISANDATTFCTGGFVSLSANGGSQYLWSNGATTQAVNASQSGLYSVTVTNAQGCTGVASQQVTANPTLAATITANGATTFCVGSSISLSANGGSQYLWSNGATTQAVNASQSGLYSVTVTNAQGCTGVASQQVTANPTLAATISANGATTFCTGGSVSLSANGGSQYLWSNGATTQAVNASQSGLYSVTVTNTQGCTGVASQTILANPIPVPTLSQNATTVCSGKPLILTTGNNYVSYQWSNAASTSNILTVTQSGTYAVTVTDTNGCKGTAFKVVSFLDLPSVNIVANGPTVFCNGNSVSLTAKWWIAIFMEQWRSNSDH
jgi:Chlorophyllase enzyme